MTSAFLMACVLGLAPLTPHGFSFEAGRSSTPYISNNGVSDLSALDMGLQPLGRRSLAPIDAITDMEMVVDETFLSDLLNLPHSGRRCFARRGMDLEFELRSVGPDGRAAWMRDAQENAENSLLQNCDKGIP